MLDNAWKLDSDTRQKIEALRDRAIAEKRRRALARATAGADGVMWREAFRGVEFRALAAGPDLMITLMRFRRGAVAQLHHHGSAQAGYVLEGKLRVTMPGRQLTVQAGECYVLPPSVPHQIRALDRCLVVDAFAPGSLDRVELEAVAASGGIGNVRAGSIPASERAGSATRACRRRRALRRRRPDAA